jgi:16S rRNA (guanine(1405)-N(7))-methyltransferase
MLVTMSKDLSTLERLVTEILSSRKYSQISPAFVQNLAERELRHRRSYKEALKATKNKLHQVGGAYQSERMDYLAWLDRLREAHAAPDPSAFHEVCREAMAFHASTRERLPVLEQFYQVTLTGLPPIRSVLDVACGLNPLALPWMGLPETVEYIAVDIYQDMLAFVAQFMSLLPIHGRTVVGDVLEFSLDREVDLAFILKTIPCLEQVDRDAGRRLLDSIPASHLLISFPVHSLGGKQVGMTAHYTARLEELLGGRSWSVHRYEFQSELAFLVSK